ncbi:MAG: hypothetical protein Q9O74_06120 [Planctomycetota bacterium]|nr:hypothetical protein [Planctomycetota bacterium]
MFKESPSVAVPEGKYRNGWPQADGFDARTHRDDSAIPLLGAEQEEFLRDWAGDWSGGVWMKVALSQSPFAGAHTLPASAKSDGVVPGLTNLVPGQYPPDDQPAADGDTNGWPRPGRDRAVQALRSGFAIHLAGDQHLSTLMRYGVDDCATRAPALPPPLKNPPAANRAHRATPATSRTGSGTNSPCWPRPIRSSPGKSRLRSTTKPPATASSA